MQTTLLLEMGAESFPERLAVADPSDRLSLGGLASRARAAAQLFLEQAGDKIVYLGLNSISLPTALFASGFGAKPFAPLNYRLPDVDLRKQLKRAAPCTAIVDDDMAARATGIDGVHVIPRSQFEADIRSRLARADEVSAGEPDIAVMLFTSGTTAEPKIAILRHQHVASYVLSSVEFMVADEAEAALVSVPSYHIAGISAVLTGIYSGRRIVYLPAFTPEGWVDLAEREKISHAMVVSTMLSRILDELESRGSGLPHLKAISYGGGRMPLSVVERAMRLLPHVDFVNAYGLTETSSTISVLGPEDHRLAIASSDPKVRGRLGSVGKPLPTLELEIRGPDGSVRPAGESGEVYVRGDQVAGEYANRKALQSDGWFATNDAGWLDDEGYLFLEGRLDDVIVRGGENIAPVEIEDVLRTHPGIADVAVFGVPDDQWGEKIACVFVPRDERPDENDLAGWVRRHLRSTKTPEAWASRSELPYNEMGKLLRRVIKQEFIAENARP